MELDIVQRGLPWIGKPYGAVTGILVPAGFALVGIVYALIMLAVRPVPSGWQARASVLSSFTAGLIAVVVYLLTFVRRLRLDG
jgi:hypothetical protein